MTHDKQFTLLGPALDAESAHVPGKAVWSITVEALKGVATESSDTPVVEENYAMRLLLQRGEPQPLRPAEKWAKARLGTIDFMRPVALAVLIRQHEQGNAPGSFSKITFAAPGFNGQTYSVSQAVQALPPHADLIAQPIGKWVAGTPPVSGTKPRFEIQPLRLVSGFVALRIKKPLGSKNLLGLVKGAPADSWNLFRNFRCAPQTVAPSKGPRIDLVPNGFEFEAYAPDSLCAVAEVAVGQAPLLRLQASVRNVGGKPVPVIALVGGPASFLDAIERGIKRFLAQLRAATIVHVDFDTRPSVPLLWWEATKVNGALEVDPSKMSLDPACLRLRISSDPPVDGGARCVAQAAIANAQLVVNAAGYDLKLHTPGTVDPQRLVLSKAAGEDTRATLLPLLPIGVDRDRIAGILTQRYQAAAVMPPDAPLAPYAFVPLRGGWLQLPIGDCVVRAPETAVPPEPASVLLGTITLGLSNAERARTEIHSATHLEIQATRPPGGTPTATVKISGASGVVRELLFIADSSPTPEECLPSLAAGPVATREVPLRFGLRKNDENCGTLKGLQLKLAWEPRSANSRDALALAWLGHAKLPLIASVPMTRTAASSEPLQSRQLVPHAWKIATGCTLKLSGGDTLPALGAFTPVSPSNVWEWPWPDVNAADDSARAAVPLVLPTLPDVELTPTNTQQIFQGASGLTVRLRHDLPLLDEYFSGVQVPKSEPTVIPQPVAKPALNVSLAPTTLDPQRLGNFWALQADRLALARTQSAPVLKWLPAEQLVTGVAVSGLFEPFVWTSTFRFNERPVAGLPVGGYDLGGTQYGGSKALAGIKQSFEVSTAALAPVATPATINIVGNASNVATLQQGGLGFDSRGLGIAAKLHVYAGHAGAPALHLRKTNYLDVPGNPALSGEAAELGTLATSLDVSLDRLPLHFWCRDLPFTEGMGGKLTFDGATSRPECALGPDAEAFDRKFAQKSAHEWRFFVPGEGRYDIPIGPFSLRPLRLWDATFERNGNSVRLVKLAIVASLSLRGRDSATESSEPFTVDDAYRTGNLVMLTIFATDVGNEAELRRVQLKRNGSAISLKVLSQKESLATPLEFMLESAVIPGAEKDDKQPLRLLLALDANSPADAKPLKFASATLELSLLGVFCGVHAAPFEIATGETRFAIEFLPSASPPLPSAPLTEVGVRRLQFEYRVEDGPSVIAELECNIRIAIDNQRSSNVIQWNSRDASLHWLGLHFNAKEIRVDHARGCIRLSVNHENSDVINDELFAGLKVKTALTSAEVLLALSRTAPEGATPANWPFVLISAAYAELYAPCPILGVARHSITVERPDPKTNPVWSSTLSLDVKPGARESWIRWPMQSLTLPENPAPQGLAAEIVSSAGGVVLQHTVCVEAYSLICGLDVFDEDFRLVKPVYARMRANHRLHGPGHDIRWATLEHVEIRDYRAIVGAAALDSSEASADHEFAFAPRYRDNTYRGEKHAKYMAHPGIATRAMAAAGIPDLATARVLKNVERAPTRLLFFGGSITLCEFPRDHTERAPSGLRWTLPWLAPVDGNMKSAVPVLSEFLQAPQGALPPLKYRVADFDLLAGAEVSWEFARPFAIDAAGTQALIDKSLLTLRRAQLVHGKANSEKPMDPATIAAVTAVDQPLIELLDANGEPIPFDESSLKVAPLFLRSLLAMRTLSQAITAGKKFPSSAFSTLLPIGADADNSASTVMRLSVSPLASTGKAFEKDDEKRKNDEAPKDVHLLIVLGRDRLAQELLDAETATLGGDSLGVARLRSAAIARIREPLLIAVARRDPAVAADEITTWHAGKFKFIAPNARRADYPVSQRSLAKREDTLFASSALGWPDELDLVGAAEFASGITNVALEVAHAADVVRDMPFQNVPEGLSGRAAAFVGATAAEKRLTDDLATEHRRALLWSHRHVVFARSGAAGGSVAPAARHLVPGRTRLRVPTTQQTRQTLHRLKGTPSVVDFQSILPGEYERTVFGARPGAMYVEVDSTLLSTGNRPLDEKFAQFGQPATASPLIIRQQRYPRSPALPAKDSAELTRRTFISWEEFSLTHKDSPRRRPLCAARGAATLFRVQDARASVLIRACKGLNDPSDPVWSAGSLSELCLAVTMPAWAEWETKNLKETLERAGLLRPNVTDAALICAERVVRFKTMEHEGEEGSDTYYLKLYEPLDDGDGVEFALRALLEQMSGDEPLVLKIGLGTELWKGGNTGAPSPMPLSIPAHPEDLGPVVPLRAQPARSIAMTLPVPPTSRRSIGLPAALCAFGDPSYDRMLWSRAQRESRTLDVQGSTTTDWLIVADRPEYNPDSVLYFAFGCLNAEGNWTAPNNVGNVPISLQIIRTMEDGTRVSFDVVAGDAPFKKLDHDVGGAQSVTHYVHYAVPSTPHAIPLRDLHLIEMEGDPPAPALPVSTQMERFVVEPSDRVVVTAWLPTVNGDRDVGLDLAIIATPVMGAPPAVYGVVAGLSNETVFESLTTYLYASAPMPQSIEFPDLAGDLARGLVRRRGLFLWNFVPTQNVSHAALVKVDRSGGGQLIDSFDDFEPFN